MKWLQGTWIRRYNGLRKLTGRSFQGWFKSLIVEPGHAFGQVCHYIHLNPVRAGAVVAEKLASYRGSSLPRLTEKGRPLWLEPQTVLSSAGPLHDTKAGWKNYLDYLVMLTTEEKAKRELISAKLSCGWCIGSAEFQKELRQEAQNKGAYLELSRFAGVEPEYFKAEQRRVWEEQLMDLVKVANIDLSQLPAKKSADPKVLLAAAMKKTSSVSNGWLAEQLQMGKPATVSQFVRRALLNSEKMKRVAVLLSKGGHRRR